MEKPLPLLWNWASKSRILQHAVPYHLAVHHASLTSEFTRASRSSCESTRTLLRFLCMKEDAKPPSNWPQELKYLRRLELSRSLLQTTKHTLAPHGVSNTAISDTRIKRIDRQDHPACGQFGLFATKDLKPGQHISDYMGRVHLPNAEDCDPTSDYDLSFRHDSLHLGIDACKMGNESRMINDYRGVQSSPNARFYSCVTKQGEIRMGVFVIGSEKKGGRGIKKGEEILISYGKGFWSDRASD